ncbi:serine hydrolase [Sphingobacterium sp. BIGb0165]|uniref:serine hydrolase domain-containing protein n=1 Tax=Sphingobacterium sp. BIGb0165 TaxID=2940615 RepID=UPI00216AB178|nr:serine hydrolase domain-containing protein [Sphingobacterium sp. BIGb0165]MCS4229063.1 CubicO group peptidase (beta-lactamase class C family) [Sphingobacterium sp. BIGb0165]
MKKIYLFVSLIGLLCSSRQAISQSHVVTRLDGSTIPGSVIDSTVTTLMDQAKVPGIGLAILNNKKTVYLKTYGYKNKLCGELLDTASIVYAASFSKAVCGFLCMKLVDSKVLDLDKPLYQYLKKPIPEYANFTGLKGDDRWKKITARMCLSHTSGFPNLKWYDPRAVNPDYDSLGMVKIYFEPGSRYAYSGEGFKLLQLALEELSGKTFDDLASELAFKPIGMYRSGYVWHSSFGDDLAIGHNAREQQNIKSKKTVAVAGGSMVTTISDYARFIEYVIQGKGIKENTFAEMIRPQIRIFSKTQFPPISTETTDENEGVQLAYGLGWGLLNTPYGRAFFKEGGDDAWKNYNINFIDRGISIVMICNSVNGSILFKDLLAQLIGDTFTPWKWEQYYPLGYKVD